MAQRTGAERLLALSARAASTRVALVLAVAAALLLAGCGGGSSATDQGQSATASARGGDQGQGQEHGGGGAAPGAEGKGETGTGQGSTATTSSLKGASSAPAGPGQKHGPRIATPKGPEEQAPTSQEVANATVADISLTSPAILAASGHLGRLAATYTCDGKDSWPALGWSGVPAGSAELALFVMNVQPVDERIFFDWAVAGIDPSLEGIETGKLPKGAVVGANGFGKQGYSLCPPGPGETYMLALYALPQSLGLKRGFDPLGVRQEVLDASGDVGLLPAVYERG